MNGNLIIKTQGPYFYVDPLKTSPFRSELRYDERLGCLLYRLQADEGVWGERDWRTYRLHLAYILEVTPAEHDTGEIFVRYQSPDDQERIHVLVVLGEDPDQRHTLIQKTVDAINALIETEKPALDLSAKGDYQRIQEFDARHSVSLLQMIQNGRKCLYGRYGEETLPFYVEADHFLFLPSDLSSLTWQGAVPTKNEVHLLEKLFVPFQEAAYVLGFETSAEYRTFYLGVHQQGIDLLEHRVALPRSDEEYIGIFVFKEGAPIPSFAMLFTPPTSPETKEQLDSLGLMAFSYTYEFYLEEVDHCMDGPHSIPLFFNHPTPIK